MLCYLLFPPATNTPPATCSYYNADYNVVKSLQAHSSCPNPLFVDAPPLSISFLFQIWFASRVCCVCSNSALTEHSASQNATSLRLDERSPHSERSEARPSLPSSLKPPRSFIFGQNVSIPPARAALASENPDGTGLGAIPKRISQADFRTHRQGQRR